MKAELKTLPDWLRDVVARFDFEQFRDEVAKNAVDEFFTSGKGDPEFEQAVWESVNENVEAIREALLGDPSRITRSYPSNPTVAARLEARMFIPASVVVQAFRAGFIRIWDSILVSARRTLVESQQDLTPADVLDGLAVLWSLIAEVENVVTQAVTDAHETEERALRSSREEMRRRALRDLIEGNDFSVVDDVSHLLRYNLNGHHVAVFLPTANDLVAKPIAMELQRRIGSRTDPLMLPMSLSSMLVWIGRDDAFDPKWLERATEVLEASGLQASVSDAESGPEGFKASHLQTQRVQAVRAALHDGGRRVLSFRDVRLEWFFINDLPTVRRFVAEELGDLSVDSASSERLRETVEVWLEVGSNVSTASRLELHEHTVRNRLRLAEELIGHPLTTRRTELQIALRLYRLAASAG